MRAPYDGALIATAATADAEAAEAALATAHGLFRDRDAWLQPGRRIEILERTARIMESRAEDLALEAAREGGKPLIDSRVEVARAIDGVKLCVDGLRTQHGTEIPMGLNASSAGRLAFTRFEPIRVVVAVCTRDLDTALKAYRRLDASAVMVNDHTAFRVDWMPFPGLGRSGHGVGGIHHTIRDMQIEKMMVVRSKEL